MGIGCNHLLPVGGQAGLARHTCSTRASQLNSNGAYIPLKDLSLQPDVLDRLEEYQLVCIDDIHCIAAQSVWENNLIALLENLENQKNLFIVSAKFPPQELGFDLQDLVNRFSRTANSKTSSDLGGNLSQNIDGSCRTPWVID